MAADGVRADFEKSRLMDQKFLMFEVLPNARHPQNKNIICRFS
jgi:hypothetical protein